MSRAYTQTSSLAAFRVVLPLDSPRRICPKSTRQCRTAGLARPSQFGDRAWFYLNNSSKRGQKVCTTAPLLRWNTLSAAVVAEGRAADKQDHGALLSRHAAPGDLPGSIPHASLAVTIVTIARRGRRITSSHIDDIVNLLGGLLGCHSVDLILNNHSQSLNACIAMRVVLIRNIYSKT